MIRVEVEFVEVSIVMVEIFMIVKKRRELSEFEKRFKIWSWVERELEVNFLRVLICFVLLCFKEW